MVVGLLAILKAGAAYVPLDPAYPAERLAHMLADSAPVLLLASTGARGAAKRSHEALAGTTPEPATPRCPLIDLVRRRPLWADQPAAPIPRPAASPPANLAYVIYTSGSTGRPRAS